MEKIKCKECGSDLTDEIKFDLGWHCMYPCDHVTYFDDDSVEMQMMQMVDYILSKIQKEMNYDDETEITTQDIERVLEREKLGGV